MSNIIEESFGASIRVLNFIGLYPSDNKCLSKKVRNLLVYLIVLVVPSVFGIVTILQEENTDILQMNFTVMFVVETISFIFRLMPIFINGSRIEKCINFFSNSCFVPVDNIEKEITAECVSFCQKISVVYVYGILVTAIVWIIQSTIVHHIPLKIWLPYDSRYNSLTYYGTFIFLFAVVFYDAFSGSMLDPIIGGLVYHATCQLKILKYNLQNLKGMEHNREFYTIFYEEVHEKLLRCIQLHKGILDFVSEYEECFSFSVFCSFAGSTFLLCFSCIGLILASESSLGTTMNLLVFVLATFQIFFYCYFGSLLFDENNGLIDAIYMGPWYNYDVNIRKCLITIMERSKKPMVITCAKVLDLNLVTFVSVFKTSYSLIAVLNNKN